MRILYLIRRPAGDDRQDFRDSVLAFAEEKLAPLAGGLTVALTEEAPPAWSVIPFRKDLVALISMEGVDELSIWPQAPEGFAGAYISDVAVPVLHSRTWAMGTRSPGVGLLTLFRRKKGLTEEDFLRRWFEGHTVLTLEVHPNVGYVRNRITGKYPDAGPEGVDHDGIVEEQYDPPGELLKPWKFFGGSALKMLPTMLRVYKDVKGFIDYSSIETWLTREYRLK